MSGGAGHEQEPSVVGAPPKASGVRVLVMEDDFLLSLALEQDLQDQGHTVVGPYPTIDAARAAAARETFDVALLDINMGGRFSFPVAEAVRARGIPLMFLTGYNRSIIPAQYGDVPHIPKPYDPALLTAEIMRLLGR
jgi:DNA-binding response OmpR family regulator